MITLENLPRLFVGDSAAVAVLSFFMTFCRVGGCLMFAPGVSSTYIPFQIRLYIAIALALFVWPGARSDVEFQTLVDNVAQLARVSACEIIRGAAVGLMGRVFFLALEFLASTASVGIGLGNPFGVAVEQSGVLPPLASFIEMSAIFMMFMGDVHLEILRGLAMSYRVAPISGVINPGATLAGYAATMNDSMLIAAHVCSPFIIYSIFVNVSLGLINKLTPQIGVVQISAPVVILGGLWILERGVLEMMTLFVVAFGRWTAGG